MHQCTTYSNDRNMGHSGQTFIGRRNQSIYSLRASVFCVFTLVLIAGKSTALPPLGVTQIDQNPGTFVFNSRLGVFDDTAYVSTQKGIWTLTSSGSPDLTTISHPEVDAGLTSVTRLVKGPDDQLYFGATFRTVDDIFFGPTGAALYRFEEPAQPLVTWHSVLDGDHMPDIAGIDTDLRTVGTLIPRFDNVASLPVEFLSDGTIEQLEMESPQPGENLVGRVANISASGFAVGVAQPSGALDTEGAVWTPEGDLEYLDANGEAFSVRDRNDGAGINIGMDFAPVLKYGPFPAIRVHSESADIEPRRPQIIVSQSDFAAVNSNLAGIGTFFYYPGLVPDDPLAILPIADVFPELASIDVDMITDLDATPDGHIFMTLSGPDGLYLFGARDPSVIPEPTALTLAVLAIMLALIAGQARAPKSTS